MSEARMANVVLDAQKNVDKFFINPTKESKMPREIHYLNDKIKPTDLKYDLFHAQT